MDSTTSTLDVWTARDTTLASSIVPENVIGYGVEAIDGSIGKVDELEPDEAESDADDDFDRAPQPGNVPAPERPLFDPETHDSEDE